MRRLHFNIFHVNNFANKRAYSSKKWTTVELKGGVKFIGEAENGEPAGFGTMYLPPNPGKLSSVSAVWPVQSTTYALVDCLGLSFVESSLKRTR